MNCITCFNTVTCEIYGCDLDYARWKNRRLSSSMFLTMNILSGSSLSVDKQVPILESEGEREGGREVGNEGMRKRRSEGEEERGRWKEEGDKERI